MTLGPEALAAAAEGLLEAALTGGDWSAPLAGFAEAAGAGGATLVRQEAFDPGGAATHSEFMLATESIAEAVAPYLRGDAPPDPRLKRVTPKLEEAFLSDFDRFTPEEIARDPFYEEFLRPFGFRWHACARLDDGRSGAHVFLSLKRRLRRGPYEAADLAALARALPTARTAVSLSRLVLEAEARGRGRILSQRGEALYEFDRRGRLVGANDLGEALLAGPLRAERRRLRAPLAAEQPRLDAALAAPYAAPAATGCAVLSEPGSSRRFVVRTLPVVGAGREIFAAAVAVAVVSVLEKPAGPPEPLVEALRAAFDLTLAEARVAALVGLGAPPHEAAARLGLSVGTARNYLKAAYAKTGAARQSELSHLVAALRR